MGPPMGPLNVGVRLYPDAMAAKKDEGKKARMLYGDGSLYEEKSSGLWVARLDVGFGPDGKRQRWKGKSKTKAGALDKLRKARAQLGSTGSVQPRGITLATWMDIWLQDIVKPRVRPHVWKDYLYTVNKHIVPRLGKVTLSKLSVEQIRSLHRHMLESGSLGNANKVLRLLKAALSDAEREGKVTRNVAKLVRMPKSPATREPMSDSDAITFIKKGVNDAMYSRYLTALLLGCRQAETLGLTWDHVDFKAGTITLEWQMRGLPYRHGCGGEGMRFPCGRQRAGSCPSKELDVPNGYEHIPLHGALCLIRPKSLAGKRVLPMPSILIDALKRRRRESIKTPNPHGLVWTDSNGQPIVASNDLQAWKEVQEELKLPVVGLHSMRHTTATVLLKLGVPDTVRIQIMGHSTAAVTRIYEHVDLTMARHALDRVADHLSAPSTGVRGA